MDRSRELIRLAGVDNNEAPQRRRCGGQEGPGAGRKDVEGPLRTTRSSTTTPSRRSRSTRRRRYSTSIKTSRRIPGLKEVGTDGEAYLMGMMDVFGELKREIIGSLSEGDVKSARFYYTMMVEMFDATRSVRFAEAVLPGLQEEAGRGQDTDGGLGLRAARLRQEDGQKIDL